MLEAFQLCWLMNLSLHGGELVCKHECALICDRSRALKSFNSVG